MGKVKSKKPKSNQIYTTVRNDEWKKSLIDFAVSEIENDPTMITLTKMYDDLDWTKFSDRPPNTSDGECKRQLQSITNEIPKRRTALEVLIKAMEKNKSTAPTPTEDHSPEEQDEVENKPVANMQWFLNMEKAEMEAWKRSEIAIAVSTNAQT